MPDGARLPDWPRAMKEELAAAYVGLSETTFRQVVIPDVRAVKLTEKRVVWLREDLDRWIDLRAGRVDAGPASGNPAAPPEATHARDPVRAALASLPPPRGSRRPRAPG